MATDTERLLQRGMRNAAGAWARLRSWIDPLDLDQLAGRRCHCRGDLPLHLVHSEALREACELVVDFGTNVRPRGRPTVAMRDLAPLVPQLRAGATVHVKTELLSEFRSVVLPRIAEPIVLVTGDSDASPGPRHWNLLEDDRIAHWFCQNWDRPGRHEKLTRIPIGLDNPVFTKWEKRLGFAITGILGKTRFDPHFRLNDMGQQADLLRIRAGLPPSSARARRALCTFHQNQKIIAPDISTLPQRSAAFAELRDTPWCHFPGRRLAQEECWLAHGSFAFEVSPSGNGMDCFRTWEALALGTIPIVMTSALDPLYTDLQLPVAIVQSWSEVTADNLAVWAELLQPRFGDAVDRKLSADYWIAMIRRAAAAAGAARRG